MPSEIRTLRAISRDCVACVVKAFAAFRKRSSASGLPISRTPATPFFLLSSAFTTLSIQRLQPATRITGTGPLKAARANPETLLPDLPGRERLQIVIEPALSQIHRV